MSDGFSACVETITGCVLVLMSATFWSGIIHDVTATAEFIAAATGAIIGTHGAVRLWRGGWRPWRWGKP